MKTVMQKKDLDLTYMASSMNTVSCPICQCNTYENVSEGPARGGMVLSYVICTECTHIYMRERPTGENYQRFYESGDYRTLTAPVRKGPQPAQEDFLNPLNKKYYSHGYRLYNEHLKELLTPDDVVFDFRCW